MGKPKIWDMRHTNPCVPFFMAMAATNLDGTVNGEEIPEGFFPTAEAALEMLKENAEEYGMEGYIFECRPVLRLKVSRRARVDKIEQKTARKR